MGFISTLEIIANELVIPIPNEVVKSLKLEAGCSVYWIPKDYGVLIKIPKNAQR